MRGRLHWRAICLLLLVSEQRPGGAALRLHRSGESRTPAWPAARWELAIDRCTLGLSVSARAPSMPVQLCQGGHFRASLSPGAMTLRGGKDHRRQASAGASRSAPVRGAAVRGRGGALRGADRKPGLVGGGVDFKNRLQQKLRSMGERRKILNDYQSKWAAENEQQERENEAVALRIKGSNDLWNKAPKGTRTKLVQDSEEEEEEDYDDGEERTEEADIGEKMQDTDEKSRAPSAVDASSQLENPAASRNASSGGIATSPDSLLRELNRTGLCLKGELDARAETFIIKLKKEGNRAALVSALKQFRDHLLRPQSHRR